MSKTIGVKENWRRLWLDYRSEFFFGAVLPINRTYLSQFVNSEYGCSFYMLVNRYRIAEAKRLMTEQPDLKIQDIADRLCRGKDTVKHYRRQIFQKLDTQSITEALAYATNYGLL